MKIFIVKIFTNKFDQDNHIQGVYSTEEKAKAAAIIAGKEFGYQIEEWNLNHEMVRSWYSDEE